MRIFNHSIINYREPVEPDADVTRDEDFNYDNLEVDLQSVNNAVITLKGLMSDMSGSLSSLTSFSNTSTDIDTGAFDTATQCVNGDANHSGFLGNLQAALTQALNVRNAVLVAEGIDPDLFEQMEDETIAEFGDVLGDHAFDVLDYIINNMELGGEAEIPSAWDSWFGTQNEGAWDFLQSIFDGIGITSEKGTEKKKEHELDDVYDNDNPYRVGKNLPYNVAFLSFSLGKFSKHMDGDSGTLYEGFGELTGEWEGMYANGSASARMGRGYIGADASFEAGIFRGELDYNNSFWTTADGQELLGVSASAEVSVVDVYAKGRAAMGIYEDEMGQRHTEVGVQAKVGVDLVKVEGEASLNVLGVEGTVSASAKIGLGAQFDVGYVDGQFQFHVGVAAGVGFEVGGSINVSGLVENAVTWLGSIFG